MDEHDHKWTPTHIGINKDADFFFVRYGCLVDNCEDEAYEDIEVNEL